MKWNQNFRNMLEATIQGTDIYLWYLRCVPSAIPSGRTTKFLSLITGIEILER